MRHLITRYLAIIGFLMLLAACAPSRPSSSNLPATATIVSLVPQSTSATSLQAIAVAGPPVMQAGSVYRYFDGSLLDAVPNDGPFSMGGGSDETQHQVTVSDFWIYSTEVSNQMYAWCVSLGKCTAPDKKDNPTFQDPQYPNYPVVGVNWQQASDYCGFAHGRLPTEAEWEKAASWDASAKQARPYPWGNQEPTCNLSNFKDCSGQANAVLQFGQGRSFYGVLNTAGNVSEWTADWYLPNYYAVAQAQDPHGPETGVVRSIRGSAFDSDASLSSPVRRFSAQPSAHRNNLGFRCVVQNAAYYAPFCQAPAFYESGSDNGSIAHPCPDPSIEHSQVCAPDHVVHDMITVHSGGSTLVQVIGLVACKPRTEDVGTAHECGMNTTIKVFASCGAMPTGAASCPPNYSPDPNHPGQCMGIGAAGACPAGFQYDPEVQCCSASPGTGVAVPLCSVGQHLYNGACVDDSSGLQQPRSVSYFTGGELSCVPGAFVPNTGGVISTMSPEPTRAAPPASNTPVPTKTSTPTRTATLKPTMTASATRTSTPVPTSTRTPTDTPLPPTHTFTPVPTHTFTPIPTHTPSSDTPVPPSDTPIPPTDTRVPPTDVPPTDVPPTDVPPTDVPPTDVPPTEKPPTQEPPTDEPPTDPAPTDAASAWLLRPPAHYLALPALRISMLEVQAF